MLLTCMLEPIPDFPGSVSCRISDFGDLVSTECGRGSKQCKK